MKLYLPILLSCLWFAPLAVAQIIPDYDLGGASKPRPDMSFRKENQYKRVHQSSLRFILRGQLDKTEAFLDQYHADHPDDAETDMRRVAAARFRITHSPRDAWRWLRAARGPGRTPIPREVG